MPAGEEEGARVSEKGAWACWECDDESEEGLRSIGRRVGEEDCATGPPVLAGEEGRIGAVDVYRVRWVVDETEVERGRNRRW